MYRTEENQNIRGTEVFENLAKAMEVRKNTHCNYVNHCKSTSHKDTSKRVMIEIIKQLKIVL